MCVSDGGGGGWVGEGISSLPGCPVGRSVGPSVRMATCLFLFAFVMCDRNERERDATGG